MIIEMFQKNNDFTWIFELILLPTLILNTCKKNNYGL